MEQREAATLYAAAVGSKADYYLPYFRRADERGYAPKSWNWPAFFLGVFWFIYRRQFRWAGIVALAAVLVSVLAAQVNLAGFPTLALALQLAFVIGVNCLYVPLNANGLYYHWVRQRLELVKKRMPLDSARQAATLSATCRPSVHLPLMIFAALLVLFLLTLPAPVDGPPTPS